LRIVTRALGSHPTLLYSWRDTTMRWNLASLFVTHAAVAVALAGCGSTDGAPADAEPSADARADGRVVGPEAGPVDGGSDATMDAQPPDQDAALDSGDGSGSDASLDAGQGGGPDAALDAGQGGDPDASLDAGEGGEPDAAVDGGTDAGGECGVPGDCPDTVPCAVKDCLLSQCGYTADPTLCEDDGNDCTVATCDLVTGCGSQNIADGTPCSAGDCLAGTCTPPPPRTFRMDTMVLADPHVVVNRSISTLIGSCPLCLDITNVEQSATCWTIVVTVPAINPMIHELITTDSTGDGYIDLSFMLTFDPLFQRDGFGGDFTLTEGRCTVDDPTTCTPLASSSITQTTTYASQDVGTCLAPAAGTVGPTPYPDGIEVTPNSPAGSCFLTAPIVFSLTLELDLLGNTHEFTIELEDAQIAGEWQEEPATGIASGLIAGFLPMELADQQDVTVSGTLAGYTVTVNVNLGRDLLPDGGNAHGCGEVPRTFPAGGISGSNTHCAGGDSRDLRDPTAPASYSNCGWWFYVNYTGVWAENASGF
jgi:hypothetical protein